MATWKIPPGGLPDRRDLDLEMLTLLRSCAPGKVIAATVRKYFPLAYVFAAQTLKNRVSSERMADAAADLALSTMEHLILRAEEGTLSYRGSGGFSAYLSRALAFSYKAKVRIEYPTAVIRRGLPAMNAYRMVLVEGYDRAAVLRLLRQEFGIEETDAGELFDLVSIYQNREMEKNRKRPGKEAEGSLDEAVDEGGHPPKSREAGPEEAFFNAHRVGALENALNSLDELPAAIIRGYLLDGRWKKISEMEAELGLKNGSYELKKAKAELLRLLS